MPSDSWKAKPRMKPVTPRPATIGPTSTPSFPRTTTIRTAQQILPITLRMKFPKSVFFLPPFSTALPTILTISLMASQPRTRITADATMLTAKESPLSVSQASACSQSSCPCESSLVNPSQILSVIAMPAFAVSLVMVFSSCEVNYTTFYFRCISN